MCDAGFEGDLWCVHLNFYMGFCVGFCVSNGTDGACVFVVSVRFTRAGIEGRWYFWTLSPERRRATATISSAVTCATWSAGVTVNTTRARVGACVTRGGRDLIATRDATVRLF